MAHIIASTNLSQCLRSLIACLGPSDLMPRYARDRLLGYIKGGGAWEQDNDTVVGNPGGPIIGIGSETCSGWTVGIGGEYAITNNLTGFVEYD